MQQTKISMETSCLFLELKTISVRLMFNKVISTCYWQTYDLTFKRQQGEIFHVLINVTYIYRGREKNTPHGQPFCSQESQD